MNGNPPHLTPTTGYIVSNFSYCSNTAWLWLKGRTLVIGTQSGIGSQSEVWKGTFPRSFNMSTYWLLEMCWEKFVILFMLISRSMSGMYKNSLLWSLSLLCVYLSLSLSFSLSLFLPVCLWLLNQSLSVSPPSPLSLCWVWVLLSLSLPLSLSLTHSLTHSHKHTLSTGTRNHLLLRSDYRFRCTHRRKE